MKFYKNVSDLIGMDPEKTYIGGGFRKDAYDIHDITISKYKLTALCNIKTSYSGTKMYHLTQTAAYNVGAQLAVGLYIVSKGISRQQKGVNFYMAKYSTEWHQLIRKEDDIRYQVEFDRIISHPQKDILVGNFNIENGSVAGAFEGVIEFQ